MAGAAPLVPITALPVGPPLAPAAFPFAPPLHPAVNVATFPEAYRINGYANLLYAANVVLGPAVVPAADVDTWAQYAGEVQLNALLSAGFQAIVNGLAAVGIAPGAAAAAAAATAAATTAAASATAAAASDAAAATSAGAAAASDAAAATSAGAAAASAAASAASTVAAGGSAGAAATAATAAGGFAGAAATSAAAAAAAAAVAPGAVAAVALAGVTASTTECKAEVQNLKAGNKNRQQFEAFHAMPSLGAINVPVFPLAVTTMVPMPAVAHPYPAGARTMAQNYNMAQAGFPWNVGHIPPLIVGGAGVFPDTCQRVMNLNHSQICRLMEAYNTTFGIVGPIIGGNSLPVRVQKIINWMCGN